ncbi:MAG TPA: hypothetical protein VGD79_14060 [Thermoanaerobaculia bacterium]|jgi:hypothetical protein
MSDDEELVPAGATEGGELELRRDVDPQALVKALRVLQERIPDSVNLTLREKQARGRVANLDPEIIENGVRLGSQWGDEMKSLLGQSPDELQTEIEKDRYWDEVEKVWALVGETIHSTNLARKHRIGAMILKIYQLVGGQLSGRAPNPRHERLRPDYERMKRSMLASLKKKSR